MKNISVYSFYKEIGRNIFCTNLRPFIRNVVKCNCSHFELLGQIIAFLGAITSCGRLSNS